jgi:hypothetical protein
MQLKQVSLQEVSVFNDDDIDGSSGVGDDLGGVSLYLWDNKQLSDMLKSRGPISNLEALPIGAVAVQIGSL